MEDEEEGHDLRQSFVTAVNYLRSGHRGLKREK